MSHNPPDSTSFRAQSFYRVDPVSSASWQIAATSAARTNPAVAAMYVNGSAGRRTATTFEDVQVNQRCWQFGETENMVESCRWVRTTGRLKRGGETGLPPLAACSGRISVNRKSLRFVPRFLAPRVGFEVCTGRLRVVVRHRNPFKRRAEILLHRRGDIAGQPLQVGPVADLGEYDHLPQALIACFLPAFEPFRDVDGLSVFIKSNRLGIVILSSALAST